MVLIVDWKANSSFVFLLWGGGGGWDGLKCCISQIVHCTYLLRSLHDHLLVMPNQKHTCKNHSWAISVCIQKNKFPIHFTRTCKWIYVSTLIALDKWPTIKLHKRSMTMPWMKNFLLDLFIQDNADYFYIDVWSSIYTWGGNDPPVAGDFVIIPAGQTILLDITTPILKVLLIQGR